MEGEKGVKSGNRDAIHVVACNMKENPKVSYRVISTVMVTVDVSLIAIRGGASFQKLYFLAVICDFGRFTILLVYNSNE